MSSNPPLRIEKKYTIASAASFVLSLLFIIIAFYETFFYVDQTWNHGLAALVYSAITSLAFAVIMFVFRDYLNKIVRYSKADILLIIYLIVSGISVLMEFIVLGKSIALYKAYSNGTINPFSSLVPTSVSSVFILFVTGFTLIILYILIGNSIRKIQGPNSNLFKILGFAFILYALSSAFYSINIIDAKFLVPLLKAIIMGVIGYLLKNPESVSIDDANDLIYNAAGDAERISQSSNEATVSLVQTDATEIDRTTELEMQTLATKYYEGLSAVEIDRLAFVATKHITTQISDDEKRQLVIKYIADNKLHDHSRYAP